MSTTYAKGRGLRVLWLCLAVILALPLGCAAKQEQTPATRSISQSREIKATTAVPSADPAASPPGSAAPGDSPEGPDGASPVSGQADPQPGLPGPSGAQAAGQAKAQAARAKSGPSPVAQLLQSAGRDPSSTQQPEPGFVLNVPQAIYDGEAFALEFGAEGAGSVTLAWREKQLALTSPSPRTGTFQALLPVPLDAKPQRLPLTMTVHWEDGRKEVFKADLAVKKRKYPVQKLNVDRKFTSPLTQEQKDKIARDRAEMRAAVGTVSPRQYWSPPMLRPVPGEVTSLYGLRRVFNGKPSNPHKGLDLDAREGDPILAADDGEVVLVSDHFYGGMTVVIDHGLGVQTVYLHLSGFNVATGQKVRRGDTIGFIGSTGRVTGPHLHLSLYVLGESVNVAPWLKM